MTAGHKLMLPHKVDEEYVDGEEESRNETNYTTDTDPHGERTESGKSKRQAAGKGVQYSIFQHFSKSTHFCKILQKILQNFAKILRISENFAKFSENCQNFGKKFRFFSRNLQNLLGRR